MQTCYLGNELLRELNPHPLVTNPGFSGNRFLNISRQTLGNEAQLVTRESLKIGESLNPHPLVTKVTSLHLDGPP